MKQLERLTHNECINVSGGRLINFAKSQFGKFAHSDVYYGDSTSPLISIESSYFGDQKDPEIMQAIFQIIQNMDSMPDGLVVCKPGTKICHYF